LRHHGASMTTTRALFASEVERIQSNVVAVLVSPGSSSDRGGLHWCGSRLRRIRISGERERRNVRLSPGGTPTGRMARMHPS
jgi:hypothetical protein